MKFRWNDLALLLRGYKRALSPLFPPACRYVPTCSEYAMEAVDRYGVLRGGVMAMWRVLALPSFCTGRIRSGGEGIRRKIQRKRCNAGATRLPITRSLSSEFA